MSEETFDSFSLDPRLKQAITQQGFVTPTPIQSSAIPLSLFEKKDIVARAKTGSGKTAAYVIPIIQNILTQELKGNIALILVPSRELCDQVQKVLNKFAVYCDRVVTSVNIGQQVSDHVQMSLLSDHPSIIVATPSRALHHVNNRNIDVQSLKYLVIDEADLVLSYGYEEDLNKLSQILPIKQSLQTWLMSATLSKEVDEMKNTFCRDMAILKLNDDISESNQLKQYYIKCGEQEKFLLAYVIFKLKLVQGKTIIFVNDIDRGYRLKLFFEQFGIKCCILNSELPISSRLHILQQFNDNVYNLVIATDQNSHFTKDEDDKDDDEQGKDNQNEIKQIDTKNEENSNKKKKKTKVEQEYGVSRGVDFQNVSCVVNFDLPSTVKAYTHRIGRTARANKVGMALSFVVPKSEFGKHRPSMLESTKRDEKVLARLIKNQQKKVDNNDTENNSNGIVQPYVFDKSQLDSFRYRMEDAFRAVTKVAIREARVKEIRQELLTSEKLKRHFEENPQDLLNLRHDKELHPARVQAHLKQCQISWSRKPIRTTS